MSDSPDEPKPLFWQGDGVSTLIWMEKYWDVCCAGSIVEMERRDNGWWYRVGVDREHWHPEDEVFKGDLATHEANERNNP